MSITGKHIINIITQFAKDNVSEIQEIVSSNAIPTKNIVWVINYPSLKMTYEGNILHKEWHIETYLASPVTLNKDKALEGLETVVDKLIGKIKSNNNLGSEEIYYADISSDVEVGNITYKVNNLTYEFIGFKINITIYHWEV